MARILHLCGGWPGRKPGEVAGWLIPKLHDAGFDTELADDSCSRSVVPVISPDRSKW
ncbi:hypothetical protein [Saccharothrix deserti]|uniref:hypothetical protein n=1 Tax=Saccharothrix deserti TaxID=2593674 RepID=UPI00131BFE68|nr:hypothetical protein [Saccharothrix deserti]